MRDAMRAQLSNRPPFTQVDWMPVLTTAAPERHEIGIECSACILSCLKPRFTRYNLLSKRFDNRVNVCIHDTTGCQTRLTTG